MIDRFRRIIEKPRNRALLLIGGVALSVHACTQYTNTGEQEVSETDVAAIEAEIGRVSTSLGNLEAYDDSDRKRAIEQPGSDSNNAQATEQAAETPEIEAYSYEVSPIVSIDIAGIIKEDKVVEYDWSSHIDANTGVVEYDPGTNFEDLFTSIEQFDSNGDNVAEESRGMLGLENGELKGVVFAFGHTHSSPEIDAIMDKVNEVKIGDVVKATTENGANYIFKVADIKLATKENPYDEAKQCGSAGRIFTCFVDGGQPTNQATYLCLDFLGIEEGNKTILANP